MSFCRRREIQHPHCAFIL